MTWRFWIDRGGTFTDCVAVDPGGALHVSKVLSSDDAPIRAIRGAMGLADGAPIPPCEVRMGTTLATNALLERRGADVALFVTDGFEDLLAIGDQRRPSLFSLRIERPAPLPAQVIGVASRGAPDGSVVARGDVAPPDGLRTCAVSVLHGTRCPELERAIGERLRAAGATHVSLSHEVDAEQGYLARTATTVVDAYLAPVLDGYLRALGAALPKSEVRLMQSSGTLTAPARFRGRNAVLSGPAGGVVAVAELARALGIERAIGFDMGGTSTDVCRYDGELETVYETEVAGLTLRAPAMAIHTVAAGGGSICEADGWRLTVGPHSAGADPGPIAYGRSDARAITLTDVQVALGRLLGDRFALPLDMDAPQGALREAARETYGDPDRWVELAQGFLRVAIAQMAEAVRTVTVARGHDPRDHGLIVFGGAGGQHACAVARELGVRRVLVHPLAGVQSALGMGLAAEGWHGEADLESVALGPGSVEGDARARLAAALDALAARGAEALPGSTTHPRVDLRYEGTHASFALPADDLTTLRARFDDLHARELGYARPEHPVIATTARMERRRSATAPSLGAFAPTDALRPIRTTRAFLGDAWLDVPVVHREELPERFVGPVIVLEDTGTLVVEPGWQARVIAGADPIAAGAIELTPTEALAGAALEADERDPVTLEVLGHALFSIAERMGHALQRTAMSTNIRERLDFSCAIFDADGMLVTNAPHIPVHLGAMGETVRAVFERHPRPEPGDVFVSNDPALGGSHLPDITVVSPVFDTQGELRFFTASRGHHADVGGITPGSMPAFSTRIEEEGVVFRALRIVRAGRLDRDAVRAVLDAPPYPARRPDENLADLEAQIAANHAGAQGLLRLAERYGADLLARTMKRLQDDAAAKVSAALARLGDGERTFEDRMDGGARIRVRIALRGGEIDIDFTGTSPETEDNLNAPRAVTVAAVIYVLRCLVEHPIPLNAGCLRPVRLTIPQGSLLDPSPGRAVAAGNVETSQRIVDVLLGALGAAAASQGTMNNVTFGDAGFGYYETLAGGAGAGPTFDGASAVHTHMTNSRITDPEVLEDRAPIRLLRFARRRGSGGVGAHPGGDGVVREYEALAPLTFSVLSERRAVAPFGLEGGGDGARGRNVLVRGDTVEELGGRARIELAPGDRVRIETPGGGGYGAAR